jgi:hypothetical protein
MYAWRTRSRQAAQAALPDAARLLLSYYAAADVAVAASSLDAVLDPSSGGDETFRREDFRPLPGVSVERAGELVWCGENRGCDRATDP